MIQTTPDGFLLRVNPSFAGMLGCDSPKGLLANVTDIIRDLHVEPSDWDVFLNKIRDQGTVRNHEVRFRRWDGDVIQVPHP